MPSDSSEIDTFRTIQCCCFNFNADVQSIDTENVAGGTNSDTNNIYNILKNI